MTQDHSGPCTPDEDSGSRKIWNEAIRVLRTYDHSLLQGRYDALARGSGHGTAWIFARIAAENGAPSLPCASRSAPDEPANLDDVAIEFFDRAGQLPTEDRVHAFLGWVATNPAEALGWNLYTGKAADAVKRAAMDESRRREEQG